LVRAIGDDFVKIMLLATSLNMGGAEMQVVALAKEFRAIGHQVALVSMIAPKYFRQSLLDSGVDVFCLDMRPGLPNPAAIFRLNSLVKQWGAEIVHSHMLHANMLASVANFFGGNFKLVSTAHSYDEFGGSRFRILFSRFCSRYCQFMTNVSKAGMERYFDLGVMKPKRDALVYNGLKFQEFRDRNKSPIPSELVGRPHAFVWLSVGRLVRVKNFLNLIAAAKILRESTSVDFSILIAGEGPDRSELSHQIEMAGLQRHVFLLGVRHDLPEVLAAVDGFVLPSNMEGMPMVLLEAVASSCPIVATDVGGVAEVIEEAGLGWLVPPRNSRDLANAMQEVMSIPKSKMEGMAEAARDKMSSKFELSVIANQWSSIYSSVIEGNTLK
jgi:glycosyltransferase involved in cell wall biosynthesis